MPDNFTLRKYCLNDWYEETLTKIKTQYIKTRKYVDTHRRNNKRKKSLQS